MRNNLKILTSLLLTLSITTSTVAVTEISTKDLSDDISSTLKMGKCIKSTIEVPQSKFKTTLGVKSNEKYASYASDLIEYYHLLFDKTLINAINKLPESGTKALENYMVVATQYAFDISIKLPGYTTTRFSKGLLLQDQLMGTLPNQTLNDLNACVSQITFKDPTLVKFKKEFTKSMSYRIDKASKFDSSKPIKKGIIGKIFK